MPCFNICNIVSLHPLRTHVILVRVPCGPNIHVRMTYIDEKRR